MKWEVCPVPSLRCMVVREGPAPPKDARIVEPAMACPTFRAFFKGADREMFVVMLLSVKQDVLGINIVSIGSLNSSVLHPREVFRPALIAPCASIILGHNHPSGDPTPSREDIEVTRRLCEAGRVLGVRMLDHIIIGDVDDQESYHSLRSSHLSLFST